MHSVITCTIEKYSSLIQWMACRLFRPKTLHEPVILYRHSVPAEYPSMNIWLKKYQHYFRKIQFKRWWPFHSSPKCVKYIIKIAWRKMFATHSITERKEIISYATICDRVTMVDAPTLVSMCVSPQVGIVNDGMALIIPYTDSHGCITHHHHITLVIN